MCDKSAPGDLTSAATAPGRPPNIRFGIPDNSTGLEVKIFNNLIRRRGQEEHLSYTCDIFLLGALYLLMSPTQQAGRSRFVDSVINESSYLLPHHFLLILLLGHNLIMTCEGGELVDLARHEVALHQEAAQVRLQPLDSRPFEVFKRVSLYVRMVVLALPT